MLGMKGREGKGREGKGREGEGRKGREGRFKSEGCGGPPRGVF